MGEVVCVSVGKQPRHRSGHTTTGTPVTVYSSHIGHNTTRWVVMVSIV